MSRRLALIIASNEYQDRRLRQLSAPSFDAEYLTRVLENKNIGKFDEVINVINGNFEIVLIEIAKFYANKNRDDLLLLYFSGHGWLDPIKGLYLATRNTNTDLIGATGISAHFIHQEMLGSFSNRKVLILDCCHSGAIFDSNKGVIGRSVDTEAAFLGKSMEGYGIIAITATDSVQNAFQGDVLKEKSNNSAFTHYLIEGIKSGEADTDHDGTITTDEIYDYLVRKFYNEKVLQQPRLFTHNQFGEIIIAYNPALLLGILSEEEYIFVHSNTPEIQEYSLKLLRRKFLEFYGQNDNTAINLVISYIEKFACSDNGKLAKSSSLLLLECRSRLDFVSGARRIDIVENETTDGSSNIANDQSITPNKKLVKKATNVYCPLCGSPRDKDLLLPCPFCGAMKYPIIGYRYKLDAKKLVIPHLLALFMKSRRDKRG